MAKRKKEFTLEDAMRAESKLRACNVPPWSCPSCGAKYYLLLPEGSSRAWVECECGYVGVVQAGASNPEPQVAGKVGLVPVTGKRLPVPKKRRRPKRPAA